MELLVTIRDKIATYAGKASYVCGNSDYVIRFDMDDEWAAYETKTGRFISEDNSYIDQLFSGNECPVPVISNTYGIRVGVFAGDLHTTTPAYIPAKKSILCASGLPQAPSDDVYAQIMERINELEQGGASEADIAAAIEKYMQKNPVQIAEADPTVPGWAKQPEKPTYTAQEVGAQPCGNYVLDRKYELIETITLEEAMAIDRTAEPDGTPYNFTHLCVRAKKPAGITIGEVSLTAYLADGRSFPIYMTNCMREEENWSYAELVQYYGLWKRGRSSSWNIYNSIATPYQMVYEMFDKPVNPGKNIIRIAGSGVQPITYEIWGVRA